MVKVSCHDYGYDCDFTVTGEVDEVVEKYNHHSEEAVSYTHLTLPTNREV